MRYPKLSDRLAMSAGMVTLGLRVADIGCDHAYMSIYLAQEGICPHVIAMDVNKGPLLKAKENILRYGLDKKIETRLSDGLKQLKPNEVDAICIGGMGGPLTVRILKEGNEVVAKLKEMILQPQSEIGFVRHYIHEIGFMIAEEHMVYEEGKYYVSMKVVPGHEYYDKEYEYQYGRRLSIEGDTVAYSYYKKELEKTVKLLKELKGKKKVSSVKGRYEELALQKEYLEILLLRFPEEMERNHE